MRREGREGGRRRRGEGGGEEVRREGREGGRRRRGEGGERRG